MRDVAAIDNLDRMPRLLRALAVHAGQLVNHTGVGAAVSLNRVTTASYTSIFEQLYLIRTLPAWHNNALKRLTKTPKLHFVDTGLLAALRGLTPDAIARDRVPFGALLESFVVSELAKIADWGGSWALRSKPPPPSMEETSPASADWRRRSATASFRGWCSTTTTRRSRSATAFGRLRWAVCGPEIHPDRRRDAFARSSNASGAVAIPGCRSARA